MSASSSAVCPGSSTLEVTELTDENRSLLRKLKKQLASNLLLKAKDWDPQALVRACSN